MHRFLLCHVLVVLVSCVYVNAIGSEVVNEEQSRILWFQSHESLADLVDGNPTQLLDSEPVIEFAVQPACDSSNTTFTVEASFIAALDSGYYKEAFNYADGNSKSFYSSGAFNYTTNFYQANNAPDVVYITQHQLSNNFAGGYLILVPSTNVKVMGGYFYATNILGDLIPGPTVVVNVTTNQRTWVVTTTTKEFRGFSANNPGEHITKLSVTFATPQNAWITVDDFYVGDLCVSSFCKATFTPSDMVKFYTNYTFNMQFSASTGKTLAQLQSTFGFYVDVVHGWNTYHNVAVTATEVTGQPGVYAIHVPMTSNFGEYVVHAYWTCYDSTPSNAMTTITVGCPAAPGLKLICEDGKVLPVVPSSHDHPHIAPGLIQADKILDCDCHLQNYQP